MWSLADKAGSTEMRKVFVETLDELMKEGKITFLQEYITRKKKEVAHHGEEPENA